MSTPIVTLSAFLAHFIKDDLAVSTVQVDTTTLRRQRRGTVDLEDIIDALEHEYTSPKQHIPQIMNLLCGLEICVPLKEKDSSMGSNESYLFPCLLPPVSRSELECWGRRKREDASSVRGHRFRERSGFIPPGVFPTILARLYQRLERGVMHPSRMWKDCAVLILNNGATHVVLSCNTEEATIDIIGYAESNEQLFVGAAKGQASVVIWTRHWVKMFLRSYNQLHFEEHWLCPNATCHGIDSSCYEGSEFLLTNIKAGPKNHDCDVEGCWRFLGTGHSFERMELHPDNAAACRTCSRPPVFALREKIGC